MTKVRSERAVTPRRSADRRAPALARQMLALLIVGCVAGGIVGCGKKGSPEHPPGSTFPRTYPAW